MFALIWMEAPNGKDATNRLQCKPTGGVTPHYVHLYTQDMDLTTRQTNTDIQVTATFSAVMEYITTAENPGRPQYLLLKR